MNRVLFHPTLFSQLKSGKRTGIYFVDSTCVPACHLKRSRRNKTFEKIAEYGRTSVGWFFGLKLQVQGDYSALEKQLLNQRGIIETVINHLKHHYLIFNLRVKNGA